MRKGSRAATLLTLCCTAAAGLTGCGGPPPDGYVAVGAAAPGPERGAGENVAPQGAVEFQQLGGPSAAGGSAVSSSTPTGTAEGPPQGGSARSGAPSGVPGGPASGPGALPGPGRATTTPGTSAPRDTPGGSGAPGGSDSPGAPSTVPTTPPGTRPGTTPPAPPPPATPARLALSTPVRAAAGDRWCERVTVTFTNTGTSAARSGTVSFATHIIGALGVDWATITTAQPLPAPIAGGAAKTQAYTVCVESWRVPLGMRVETRKVTAAWS